MAARLRIVYAYALYTAVLLPPHDFCAAARFPRANAATRATITQQSTINCAAARCAFARCRGMLAFAAGSFLFAFRFLSRLHHAYAFYTTTCRTCARAAWHVLPACVLTSLRCTACCCLAITTPYSVRSAAYAYPPCSLLYRPLTYTIFTFLCMTYRIICMYFMYFIHNNHICRRAYQRMTCNITYITSHYS